jgi:acyl dehydratase
VITLTSYADLSDRVGDELGTSDWLTVDQDLINRFAELTRDFMWVHTDPERARRELPHGRTIAHGLLIFSLIPQLSYQILNVADPGLTFSYGANRLRYVSPVKCGDRVRLRSTLVGARREQDRTYLTFEYVIEIEGESKPALVAEQILLTYH